MTLPTITWSSPFGATRIPGATRSILILILEPTNYHHSTAFDSVLVKRLCWVHSTVLFISHYHSIYHSVPAWDHLPGCLGLFIYHHQGHHSLIPTTGCSTMQSWGLLPFWNLPPFLQKTWAYLGDGCHSRPIITTCKPHNCGWGGLWEISFRDVLPGFIVRSCGSGPDLPYVTAAARSTCSTCTATCLPGTPFATTVTCRTRFWVGHRRLPVAATS